MNEPMPILTWKAPIISRRFEPHPGGQRFGHCVRCLFGGRRHVKSVVIVYQTHAGLSDPAMYGLCANHAELLEELGAQAATIAQQLPNTEEKEECGE